MHCRSISEFEFLLFGSGSGLVKLGSTVQCGRKTGIWGRGGGVKSDGVTTGKEASSSLWFRAPDFFRHFCPSFGLPSRFVVIVLSFFLFSSLYWHHDMSFTIFFHYDYTTTGGWLLD